jgi:hypothetical protein
MMLNCPVCPDALWHAVQFASPGAPVRPVGGPPLDASDGIVADDEKAIAAIIRKAKETRTVDLILRTVVMMILHRYCQSDPGSGLPSG